MVSLSTKKNVNILSNLIYLIFSVQRMFTYIKEVNKSHAKPCLYAIWHAHQCCLHGMKNKSELSVLISKSKDGEIIAGVVEKWGIHTIRGSKGKKGAVEATIQIINELKEGRSCAITVDGPNGPAKIVKDGIVKIAQLANVPIVPVYWYANGWNFVKFPSWDGFRFPVFANYMINAYGAPVYVKSEQPEDIENCRLEVQRELEDLERKAPLLHKQAWGIRLWGKKKKK